MTSEVKRAERDAADNVVEGMFGWHADEIHLEFLGDDAEMMLRLLNSFISSSRTSEEISFSEELVYWAMFQSVDTTSLAIAGLPLTELALIKR